jgi:DNA-binding SARP family transcriptional activator/tetratricopeptide (TPR) repeat protein
MRFGILGPLAIQRDDGTEIGLAGARRRTLLQRLLLAPNRAVPASALCDDIWSGAPPAGAAQTLQSHVSHLRKVLGHDRLLTSDGSYVLAVEDDELDSACFEEDVATAREWLANGKAADTPAHLATALSRWRGDALAEVAGEPWAMPEAARLTELRVLANELLLDALLKVGDHERVVSESARLATEYPFHERFWAQAMLALYRSGRQTDALRTYTRLRETLVAELGIEPSSDVRRIEQAILEHDDAILLEPTPANTSPATASALPSGVVTFVLTDVVSSTRLWEQASAAMAHALEDHDAIVRDVVRSAGGVLLKARGEGDSTFSVFQRASDAVAAAAEMQVRLEHTEWPVGAAISVRIAVHSGEAIERDGDYFGTTVNRAARLRAAADIGDILVSAPTAELVIDQLPSNTRLVELGPIALRDLDRPEVTYALRTGAAPSDADSNAPSPSPAAVPLPERVVALADEVRHGAFVGRRREMQQLEAAYNDAAQARASVAVVSGEPGIGKTRLVSSWATSAYTQGAIVLYGRCDQQLGLAYQPWIEAMTHLVAHAPDALLADHVARHGPHLARLVPDLARRVQPVRLSADSPVDERYVLFRAVADLLRRAAEQRPVVVILDDMHEADTPSLQLFGHLVHHDRPGSTVLLATQRPVAVDHPLAALLARRDSDVTTIPLAGLDPDEVLALVESLAGHVIDSESARLRDELHAETAGNPFFVVELVRSLAETGAVEQDAHGRWVASQALLERGLPTSIRDVVAQRIVRLGAESESILGVGAVFGGAFDVEIVADVAERSQRDVIDACDRAVTAGLLQEDAEPGRYAFAHALVARALRERLSSARRAMLHRDIALAIEARTGPLPERAGELAIHWSNAGRTEIDKVVFYSQLAGDRALHQLAPAAAAEWYNVGLTALATTSDDDPRRPSLLCGLGEAQRDLGEPAHRDTLLRAGSAARAVGQPDVLIRAALSNHRGWTSIVGDVDRERVDALEHALAVAIPESTAHARLLATLCVEKHYAVSLTERVDLASEAVRIARLHDDPATLAFALAMPFMSISAPHTLAVRTDWTEEACRAAAAANDPTLRFWTHTYRGLAALAAGDLETLREHSAIASAEAIRIGSPLLVWENMLHRGTAEILAGDLEAAERTAAEAFDRGTALGQPDVLIIIGGLFDVIRWMQGRLDEIVATMGDLTAASPTVEITRAGLAFALARLGRLDEAREAMLPFAERDFNLFADANWLMSTVILAEACVRVDDQRAIELMRDRLAPFHDQVAMTHSTVVGSVAHYLGLLAGGAGDWRAARQYFEEALVCHEALEAPYFVTATEVALGHALRRAPGSTNRDRGVAMLQRAHARAEARDYRDVAADATLALEA